ncbi:MAG: formylglycine-generating enzyme family protein [Elusimicrobiota bacterium]
MEGSPLIFAVLLAAWPAAAEAPKTVEWVTIRGGGFTMGSDSGEQDEQPRHRVKVRTFQMAKTEVTVAQYGACVRAGGCSPPGAEGNCNWSQAERDDHPVNCVDWNQAKAFAQWAGGRLPSEAEWEYAARSRGKARAYPWGDKQASCARAVMLDEALGCGKGSTWPVCSRPDGNTKQGLCDMAGSVWEWVEDRYHGSYAGAPADGSAWEASASSGRVERGGSWDYSMGGVRAANRSSNDPDFRNVGLGFRLARDAAP